MYARVVACLLMPIYLLTSCSAEDEKSDHYDNPFEQRTQWYVNEWWSKIAEFDGGEAIMYENTAVWMKKTSDIEEFNDERPESFFGLRDHLEDALAQGSDLFLLSLYNLPGRGCAIAGFPSELQATAQGMKTYKEEYIGRLVRVLEDEKYAEMSIVIILEMDSLLNVAKYPDDCKDVDNSKEWGYTEGVRYALTQFKTLANVYTYIPVGHSGIMGWDVDFEVGAMFIAGVIDGFGKHGNLDDLSRLVKDSGVADYQNLKSTMRESLGPTPAPGWSSISGFITNTANYSPLEEPYLEALKVLEGDDYPLHTAQFYDWNPTFGELEYAKNWYERMSSYSGVDSLGMLIDTSRNGWGGEGRPSQVTDAERAVMSIDEMVDSLRVDRREYRSNWCNQMGAGIGERPRANPESYIDAYVWVKPPGESDGGNTEEYDSTIEINEPPRSYPDRCKFEEYIRLPETGEPVGLNGVPTGALEDAPQWTRWFDEAFKTLLENAHPPI